MQIICHYHFVKDLGKDISRDYDQFRSSMVATKALARISSINMPENGSGITYAEKIWAEIASEYILYPRNIPSKYPFVLPYFDVLGRCMEIQGMLKNIIKWNASHMKMIREVQDLDTSVDRITHDEMVMEGYRILSRTWAWFESIRKALRVSRELSSSGSDGKPISIE